MSTKDILLADNCPPLFGNIPLTLLLSDVSQVDATREMTVGPNHDRTRASGNTVSMSSNAFRQLATQKDSYRPYTGSPIADREFGTSSSGQVSALFEDSVQHASEQRSAALVRPTPAPERLLPRRRDMAADLGIPTLKCLAMETLAWNLDGFRELSAVDHLPWVAYGRDLLRVVLEQAAPLSVDVDSRYEESPSGNAVSSSAQVPSSSSMAALAPRILSLEAISVLQFYMLSAARAIFGKHGATRVDDEWVAEQVRYGSIDSSPTVNDTSELVRYFRAVTTLNVNGSVAGSASWTNMAVMSIMNHRPLLNVTRALCLTVENVQVLSEDSWSSIAHLYALERLELRV